MKGHPLPKTGTAVIEYAHSGIPDEQLKAEVFNDRQLAVLKTLPPERQEQVKKGCPVSVISMDTGETLASFNMRNISLSKIDKKILASSVLESVEKYFKDPENVKKYEEWMKTHGGAKRDT